MAIGLGSNFKIYEEQFHTGATEIMQQEAQVFNDASNGSMLLSTMMHKGNYTQEAFYQELAGLVSRRDVTSVAAAADIAMTQGEKVGVKNNRKIGPVAQTLDAFRKISADPEEMSYILGQQWGKAILLDQVNTSLSAAAPAFAQTYRTGGTQAGGNGDIGDTAVGDTINHSSLVDLQALYGDAGQRVSAFVMHSKAYYDLMKQSISDNVYNVAGVTIHEGSVATLGKPVIVTDSASLISSGTGNTTAHNEYFTLALTSGAIEVEESEDRQIVSDLITGLENLVLRYQGEYAYTVKLKGYAWDITNGGLNPTAAAMALATNWDKVVTDDKSTGGARLITA